ncbi:MAG: hypothetical protein ACR2RB_05625 [Gammaproteobacteria bacterium]
MRPPAKVMRLPRLGAFHQTRLSFSRSLIRTMIREQWRIERPVFDLDAQGFGTVVYQVHTPRGRYGFVAFSDHLDPQNRTDRVIAERWDATFALIEGDATPARVADLRANIPKQEAGRCCAGDIVLSRANRSVRMFEHVVDQLAAGRQPDRHEVIKVGYLMRTTAVYGNGKFGLSDFDGIRQRSVFSQPFRAEMLAVYLARLLSVDLVEHLAKARAPDTAVPLDRDIKRLFGVGNATGLGMAPFLINHPRLINQWIATRELAIARVKAVRSAGFRRRTRFGELLQRAVAHIAQIHTNDAGQRHKNEVLRDELREIESRRSADSLLPERAPWQFLAEWADKNTSLETQELLNSILLELYPERVDPLAETMGCDEPADLDPSMPLTQLKAVVERNYDWALSVDYDEPQEQHYFWYRSAEKEEPRLGERFNEPGADKEMVIGIGRAVANLHAHLCGLTQAQVSRPVAYLLLEHPRFRGIVRRIQSLADCPYAEVRDNTLAASCLPVDLLRCKLSFFGAGKFDPKSDRWTRITLFQGAPLPDELDNENADDWNFYCAPLP